MDIAKEKIYKTVKPDIDSYTELCKKDIPYVRVHAVTLPLSEYLQWEILSYNELCKLGQRILIADFTRLENYLINSYDFLLFDEKTVMVQDYGNDGILSGGWFSSDKNIVNKFCKISYELTKLSVSLGEFEYGLVRGK